MSSQHYQMYPTGRLGWRKDKYDSRDYLHKLVPLIPDEVILSNLLTEVRNQGNVGSCVGFGLGVNINSVLKSQTYYIEWQSPTWIYNGARFIEGTLSEDVGCSPRDALQWLLMHGCLLER